MRSRLEPTSGDLNQLNPAKTRPTAHLKQLHRLSTIHYDCVDQVFSEYLSTGCDLFRMPLGMILQVDNGEYVIAAIHGCSATLRVGSRIALGAMNWTTVADRLRTEVVTNLEAGAAAPRVPELTVCLAAPILAGNELYGTLSFSGGDARVFSQEEREVVELMAGGIGHSIREGRIRSDQKSWDELERSRNTALEMMAENRPLADTLAQVAAMVESQCPGATCSVVLNTETHATQRLDSKIWPIASGAGLSLGAIVVDSDTAHALAPEVMSMACRLARVAIEQRQLTERLEFQAQHDCLTGLPNRFHVQALLAQRLLDAQSRNGRLAVFFIDLDRFKQINDTLGHLIGDRILVQVAERLKVLLNPEDVAGRMGGDEFTVILSNPADQDFVFRAARQFLHSLQAPYLVDQHELFVT
ncbi:MAG: diguanylate cyclase, partial [Acidobacteriota bacterium]|nr:diguanylate cyclase [Acidobacteriota bacterium]